VAFPPGGRGALDGPYAQALYVLVRVLRPRVIVETGIGNGYSSLFLLAALESNGEGHLHSIGWDEPGAYLPAGSTSGWLVPSELGRRWRRIEGRSSEELPGLLRRLGSVDLFLHDSDHSRENQAFEMSEAWRYLPPGSVIACDDVRASDAFDTLLSERHCRARIIDGRLGVLIKQG